MVSDERFFAWLDGELGESDAAEVEREVAADPALARRAEEHRALGQRLGKAFAPIAEAPVPDRLQEMLQPADAKVIDFDSARRGREVRRTWRPQQWAAMAATLAVGIFAGTMVPRESSAPVAIEKGHLYAAASLGQALDAQLAGAAGTDGVRVGTTYRDHSGAICRSFTQPASSGLACHDSNGWRMRGLFAAPEGQSGEFRMAAGMDPGLAALIDTTIDGEPLDAAQEQAAKARGWR